MMNGSLSDLAGILDRCQTSIAAILRQSVAAAQRADALADLLRELLPQTSLTACLLRDEGGVCLTIRPGSERLGSEHELLMRSQLSSLNPVAPGVQKLRAEALPGLHLLAASIHEEESTRGFLVMGLPAEAGAEDVARAEAVLTAAAPAVALRWMLESVQHERAELARFALIGQAFTGLAHELNNALNSMMLQTSVVQLRVDPQVRQELAAIRQHGVQAAALVRSLQHVVQERREQSYDVELNSVLREVLDEETKLRRRFVPRLEANVPRIHSIRSAVKQLIRLLLEGVCAATKATVKAATSEQDGGAALTLTIAADSDTEGDPPTAETLLWQNLDEVGRQAGQSLLRQLGGTLTTEPAKGGTLILRVVWRPPA
jgi:signal transduction histidine kinase